MKYLKYYENLCSASQYIIQSTFNENKMWYKTITQILEYLESKSKIPWIFIDCETTGLGRKGTGAMIYVITLNQN